MSHWLFAQPYSITKLRTIHALALNESQSFIGMEATFTPKIDSKLMSDLLKPIASRRLIQT